MNLEPLLDDQDDAVATAALDALVRVATLQTSLPVAIAATFHTFNFSPMKNTASKAVHIGMVNSIEITCARGIRVTATNQAYCAVK